MFVVDTDVSEQPIRPVQQRDFFTCGCFVTGRGGKITASMFLKVKRIARETAICRNAQTHNFTRQRNNFMDP
jgi:hypothetical protein